MDLDVNKALYKSTEVALQSLGKGDVCLLTLQLIESDVEIAPDNFDLKKFAPALNKLLGDGSETILELVYKNKYTIVQICGPWKRSTRF